jgi:phage baseplate assembly protein W
VADAQAKAFLGNGWAWPAGTDGRGHVRLSAHEDDVREAIGIILGTAKGERVMRPDFGAGLKALVFEPITATTKELVRLRVVEALTDWEPRIDQVKVEVVPDPPLGRLAIRIRYRIRATNTFYNLVYPFYLLEGKQS